ncbi:MAG: GNAT family N-acetyltransferase [Acidobacteria bacterium]|nr:GNAT family N-acetyltransferase [Acidobacteriota bacterium]
MTSAGNGVGLLQGTRVALEPLSLTYCAELAASALEDRATYGFTRVPQGIDAMNDEITGLLETDDVVAFAQRDVASERLVGMTRFMTMRSRPGARAPYALEIGGTWLAASAQRSGINTEAKFLLMSYAFEQWGTTRVELKTDVRNERSKAAITRLGATFEGALRHFQPSLVAGEEEQYRDTAMFSVVDDEWPRVKARLLTLMH